MGAFRMKTALYPGTFDPLTNGHLSLIRRGLEVFDRIIVAVAETTPKNPLFTLEARVALAAEAVRHLKRAEVLPFTGLTVDCALELGVCAILRGLRAVSDFEYEFQLALMNRRLRPHIQTVFMMTDYQWLYISSTIIKSAASQGADVKGLVPENVRLALAEKYQEGAVRRGTPCLGAPHGGFGAGSPVGA
ncbi:pantetheine-phosphate adenylyltransferase [Desulfovibrio sp.]|uniref:pantetheine-phosphate adenylyltransferase n=1 Tax=Desulfovibrio sp. TaxID=885 RepID=UPI0025BC3D64|nr:pantetheine-phosphate adenylyltransferase [Desulfovibrio sp.]